MINTRIFKTTEELITATEMLLHETLKEPGALMLSGGSTPYTIYNRIAKAPCPVDPGRKLFLSDERAVPADDPANNAGNLMPMLEALHCTDHFIRVQTELTPLGATVKFAQELEALPPMDLGLLGMGTDGHTAGIFDRCDAERRDAHLAFHTARPDGMMGVSVTPTLLHRIQRLILLVTGDAKQQVIQTLLAKPETLIAGMALKDHPCVELWTDCTLS